MTFVDLSVLLLVALLLGFGYIVWVLASKEVAATKTAGQTISIIIVGLTVILFIVGMVAGGGKRLYLNCPGCKMMSHEGAMMPGGERCQMMNNQAMPKMMMEKHQGMK